jgi:hypothetical protein
MFDISFVNLFLLVCILGLNLYLIMDLLKPKKKPKKKAKKKAVIKKTASAKNSSVMNASVDFQKIRTAEIEIPVIAEDVLVYGPGELGASYPETTRLYYSADAISDPEYLETVKRSPLQVQTHEKNTSEFNRDVDGWPTEAWWDDSKKRVMAKGVLHGEENVKYAESNLSKPGFGTSAFISFLKLEKKTGTAPNGKPYDAIVRKAVNNHIAILPNIRDTNNTIVALNAVEVANSEEEKTIDNSEEENKTQGHEEKKEAKKMPLDKEEFKEMYNAIRNEEKEAEEKAEKLKNAIKNELAEEGKTKDKEEAKDAKNEDEEKKEDEEAANALPSEEMLKDFSSHLGITFHKTPTLKALGKLVGVKNEDSFELITALNAKRKEFTSSKPEEAKNSNVIKSLDDVMKEI